MISVALEEGGYETEVDSGGYIKAYSPNNNLIIFPVSRCLSNKKMVETTMISAEEKAIAKLVKRAEELADEYIPCIGFGVGKYGYFDSEVCVVPVEVWKQKQNVDQSFQIQVENITIIMIRLQIKRQMEQY